MMEENASIKAGVIAAAVAGVEEHNAVKADLMTTTKSDNELDVDSTATSLPSPKNEEARERAINAFKAELMTTTKSDNELDVDSDVTSLPWSRKRFHYVEKDEEAWERAMYLFPGLVKEYHTRIGRRVQTVVSELLSEKVAKLKEQDGGARFDYLMQQGKAIELCLELGLNETVVRKRYEAISNFQQEFNIVSKTPTLLSIRHLIRRIGVNKKFPLVKPPAADGDGLIREKYMGKEWLSYLGIQIKKGNFARALKHVNDQLNEFKYDGSYVHGTTATALWQIAECEDIGASCIKLEQGGERHDFGPGVYCFKGELEYALSLAIDRCWPIYSDGSLSKHNPAVIVFPNAHQFSRRQASKVVYHVEKNSFNSVLTIREGNRKFQEFQTRLNLENNCWEDKNWKTFLKLSRFFCKIPKEKRLFIGWLHDCYSTALTDQCNGVPKIDPGRWIQYCFTDPKDLGDDQLFIEFDVDWNDWLPDGTSNGAAGKEAKSSFELWNEELC